MNNKITRWIKNYKTFSVLALAMTILVGTTIWNNRPNSMRTPRYVVEKDFSSVTGSFDFSKDIESLEYSLNTKVKKTDFKLEQPYCLSHDNIDICINGYELFETKDKKDVDVSYKKVKTKNFMIVNMSVINNTDNRINVSDIGRATNANYASIQPISADRGSIQLDNNLTNPDLYSGGVYTIEPGENLTGSLIYALSSSVYSDLYFEGNFSMEIPMIVDTDALNTQGYFGVYYAIELPVVPTVLEKYIKSVESIPTQVTKNNSGYNEVVTRTDLDIPLQSDDGSISVVLKRIEDSIATYKPSYLDRRSHYTGNKSQKFTTLKIEFTNNTNQAINSGDLNISLGPKDIDRNDTLTGLSYVTIQQGETRELVFEYNNYSGGYLEHPKDRLLQFKIKVYGGSILMDTTFTIEK